MDTLEYWEEKHQLPRYVSTAIDWNTCGIAYRGLPLSKQRRVTKHASGNCGTGYILQKRGYQVHSNCPRCDHEDEDTQHVLQCPDRRAQAQWDTEIRQLTDWMQEHKTQPDLIHSIKNALNNWRNNNTNQPALFRLTETTKLAIEEQYAIGWYQFLLGRISHVMVDAQNEHYKKIRSQKSGQSWATGLVRQVWKITWGMWEHRNDILHQKITPQKLRKKNQLLVLVEEQFQLGADGLAPTDRTKLRDKQRIKNLGIPEMKLWIKSMELARDTAARQEEQQAQSPRNITFLQVHGQALR